MQRDGDNLTLIMPGNVRYEVDLSRLNLDDVRWDEATKTLAVRLPPISVAGPEIDQAQRYRVCEIISGESNMNLGYKIGLLGALFAMAVALPIGYLSVRRTGIYFAMVTLAFAQMLFFIVNQWRGLTGGENGLQGVPAGFFGIEAVEREAFWFYYAALPMIIAGMWLAWRVVHSPFGRVLVATRDNPARARALGYDVEKYRVMVFVISAGLAAGMVLFFYGLGQYVMVLFADAGARTLLTVSLPIERALEIAEEQGLDLVEVAPMARPPVCRIMDYGKFRYEEQRKAREARKKQHQVQLKEVKMRPGIEDHDFDFKLRHARRFLEEGNKVKITMMFRGRQMAHPELGREVLDRVVQEVADVGKVESNPMMEARSMTMVLAPLKG